MVNNVPVKRVSSHKHLGLILDPKFDFNEYLNSVVYKFLKMVALLRRFQSILPRHTLLSIC